MKFSSLKSGKTIILLLVVYLSFQDAVVSGIAYIHATVIS